MKNLSLANTDSKNQMNINLLLENHKAQMKKVSQTARKKDSSNNQKSPNDFASELEKQNEQTKRKSVVKLLPVEPRPSAGSIKRSSLIEMTNAVYSNQKSKIMNKKGISNFVRNPRAPNVKISSGLSIKQIARQKTELTSLVNIQEEIKETDESELSEQESPDQTKNEIESGDPGLHVINETDEVITLKKTLSRNIGISMSGINEMIENEKNPKIDNSFMNFDIPKGDDLNKIYKTDVLRPMTERTNNPSNRITFSNFITVFERSTTTKNLPQIKTKSVMKASSLVSALKFTKSLKSKEIPGDVSSIPEKSDRSALKQSKCFCFF
jgi:hypothetical protein